MAEDRKRGPDDELLAGFVMGWTVALEAHGIENPSPRLEQGHAILREIAEGRLTLLLPVDEIIRQSPVPINPEFEAILREHDPGRMAEERNDAQRILRMISGPPRKPRGRG